MNLKSGSVDQFEQCSQFNNLQEFNVHLEMWLAVNKEKFSKGELVGLKRLARFAAKVPGVSNAKIGTVLKAIHEEYSGNGISRSTFKRMIVKASELGIFTVHETERKNGSQSSNLYIFNRFPKSEPPKEKKMDHHNKTINLSKTNKNQKNNKRNETGLDYTYTSDRVPNAFVDAVKYFFPEAKSFEEFWRMTTIAAYRNNREQNKLQVLDTAIHSFKQLIGKMKSSIIAKPIAYFYGILNQKFEELYFEDLLDMGFSLNNDQSYMGFFYK
jgi:N-acetylglutamate synthase-like GNAT family acetyltransferase